LIYSRFSFEHFIVLHAARGGDWGNPPSKTYESNPFRHDFYNSERHLTAN